VSVLLGTLETIAELARDDDGATLTIERGSISGKSFLVAEDPDVGNVQLDLDPARAREIAVGLNRWAEGERDPDVPAKVEAEAFDGAVIAKFEMRAEKTLPFRYGYAFRLTREQALELRTELGRAVAELDASGKADTEPPPQAQIVDLGAALMRSVTGKESSR
jgi:hypothetical protein